jgi:hypothetical protein
MARSVGVRACVWAAAFVGIPALLVGCSLEASVGFDEGRSEATTPGAEVESGEVSAHDIRVGDCYMDDGGPGGEGGKDIFGVEAVPCDEPHDNEVYASFALADGDFPGADEVFHLALAGCVRRFADFTAVAYGATSLEVKTLHPTRLSWVSLGDRGVTCAVFDPAGPLERSVRGAGDAYPAPSAGDCLDGEFWLVDCAVEHESELYLVTEMSGDEYPGTRAAQDAAIKLCRDAFPDYIGIDYEQSTLDFVYFWPEELMWDAGVRAVRCAVYDPEASLTGSVKGSGR